MREPYQVLVILYNNDKELKVCVFHRKKQTIGNLYQAEKSRMIEI